MATELFKNSSAFYSRKFIIIYARDKQMNPTNALSSYFFKRYFNIFPHFYLGFHFDLFLSGFTA